jgi:hypothetical protein
MVCKEIPLKPMECYNCNKIICFLCELRQTYKNGQKVERSQCYNCGIYEVIKVSTAQSNDSIESKNNSDGQSQNQNVTPTPNAGHLYYDMQDA